MLERIDARRALPGGSFQKVQKLVVFTEKLLKRKHCPAFRTATSKKVDEKMTRDRHATGVIAYPKGVLCTK